MKYRETTFLEDIGFLKVFSYSIDYPDNYRNAQLHLPLQTAQSMRVTNLPSALCLKWETVHNSTFFSVDQRTETQPFLVCLSFNKSYFVSDHTDFFMLTKTYLTLAQVPQDVGWHPPKMLYEGIFLAKPFGSSSSKTHWDTVEFWYLGSSRSALLSFSSLLTMRTASPTAGRRRSMLRALWEALSFSSPTSEGRCQMSSKLPSQTLSDMKHPLSHTEPQNRSEKSLSRILKPSSLWTWTVQWYEPPSQ